MSYFNMFSPRKTRSSEAHTSFSVLTKNIPITDVSCARRVDDDHIGSPERPDSNIPTPQVPGDLRTDDRLANIESMLKTGTSVLPSISAIEEDIKLIKTEHSAKLTVVVCKVSVLEHDLTDVKAENQKLSTQNKLLSDRLHRL